MEKDFKKYDDCELTTIHNSQSIYNKKKPNVQFFGELGDLGEFEGGLMEGEGIEVEEKTIITSKEDVLKHILAKRNKQSITKSEVGAGSACHQCTLQ